MPNFSCTIDATHPSNRARATTMTTAHGQFTTPCFMPVATRAFLNLMTPIQLQQAGIDMILGGNTYHMLLAPGMETLETLGGMHPFMDWQGPMLTDSGGFQVFSLAKNSKLCQIDDEGATFKRPNSNETIRLTPETSLATQKIIGADIIMAFDQCTPDIDDKALVTAAMEKTHRWLSQCIEYQQQHPNAVYGHPQALFGIIQGAYFEDLRQQSATFVAQAGVDGVAIGGESVGFDMRKTIDIVQWIHDLLPPTKPRYTMGVGMQPQDLIDVVTQGIDMFDCVAPTRNARHGALYHGHIVKQGDWIAFVSDEPRQRINIKNARYEADDSPIIDDCDCYTCQHFSRAYLHYLFRQQAVFFSNLACIHNVRTMQRVCDAMRDCILR